MKRSKTLLETIELTKNLLEKGGPEPEEYILLSSNLDLLGKEIKSRQIDIKDLQKIQSIFDEDFVRETLIGHCLSKPYGYSGDFMIIDKVYRNHLSSKHEKWDKYFNNVDAANAVRNRKEYFKNLVNRQFKKYGRDLKLLNIASGPARDLYEYLSEHKTNKFKVECIEYDKKAINYAKKLCLNFSDQINFIHANIFKYRTDKKYNLIWSAGLFDYFSDKIFVKILKKILDWCDEGAEIIIGNFCTSNPTRNFMEIFLDWHLYHRDKNHLKDLAIKAGCKEENISIEKESTGINLFLRIKK